MKANIIMKISNIKQMAERRKNAYEAIPNPLFP
jgi:hypothetical protein